MKISVDVIAGPMAGRSFELKRGASIVFGRDPRCACRLDGDPTVSQAHFLLESARPGIRLVDLGSTNGVYVNGTPYGGKRRGSGHTVVLSPGDVVMAGHTVLRLTFEGSPAASEIPPGDSGTPIRGTGLTRMYIASPLTFGGRLLPEKEGVPGGNGRRAPVIADYVLGKKIDAGGKAAVYRATHRITGEKAAIKLLLPKAARRPRAFEAFRREIRITGRLSHPNIVKYLGDGLSRGEHYLALEYMEGGNLEKLISGSPGGRIGPLRALRIAERILDALAYMHGLSLVHRDVKPKNILMDGDPGENAVKLGDMGLAGSFDAGTRMSGLFPAVADGGTPAYMPPEQLAEPSRVMPQSDVFSLSATLYQMLTGAIPYAFPEGGDRTESIMNYDLIPLGARPSDLPENVVRLVDRGLSRDPGKRYGDAAEMRLALLAAAGGLHDPASP